MSYEELKKKLKEIERGMWMAITKTVRANLLAKSFSIRTKTFALLNLCTFAAKC